jgi:hypothetical protein
MMWLWRNWWNEDWQGKRKYSEKTCPSATLSTTNPTWPDPGSNPSHRGGKPATNRLSYGAALFTKLLLGWWTVLNLFIPLHRSLMFLFLLFVASSLILCIRYSLFLLLKCLLASHLMIFRLSPFISLGSYNHCNFPVSFYLTILGVLRGTIDYASSIRSNLDFLWLKFWYSLSKFS